MPPSNTAPLHLMVQVSVGLVDRITQTRNLSHDCKSTFLQLYNEDTHTKKKENLCWEKRDKIETYSHCLAELTPQPCTYTHTHTDVNTLVSYHPPHFGHCIRLFLNLGFFQNLSQSFLCCCCSFQRSCTVNLYSSSLLNLIYSLWLPTLVYSRVQGCRSSTTEALSWILNFWGKTSLRIA